MTRGVRVALATAGAVLGGAVAAAVLGARAWDRETARMAARVTAAARGAHARPMSTGNRHAANGRGLSSGVEDGRGTG